MSCSDLTKHLDDILKLYGASEVTSSLIKNIDEMKDLLISKMDRNVINYSRSRFIDANKEGVFSIMRCNPQDLIKDSEENKGIWLEYPFLDILKENDMIDEDQSEPSSQSTISDTMSEIAGHLKKEKNLPFRAAENNHNWYLCLDNIDGEVPERIEIDWNNIVLWYKKTHLFI